MFEISLILKKFLPPTLKSGHGGPPITPKHFGLRPLNASVKMSSALLFRSSESKKHILEREGRSRERAKKKCMTFRAAPPVLERRTHAGPNKEKLLAIAIGGQTQQ